MDIDIIIKQLVSTLALVQKTEVEASSATAQNTAANSGIGASAATTVDKPVPKPKPTVSAAAPGAAKVVMGLKQITQHVTRNNESTVSAGDAAGATSAVPVSGAADVKLVLLAPDTENSVELDKQILKLVNGCGTHSSSLCPGGTVPILYCLSRRQLGKICQSQLRQAAVGLVSITPLFSSDPSYNAAATATAQLFGQGGSTQRAQWSSLDDQYYQSLLKSDPPPSASILLQNVPRRHLVGYCGWLYGKVVDFVNS